MRNVRAGVVVRERIVCDVFLFILNLSFGWWSDKAGVDESLETLP